MSTGRTATEQAVIEAMTATEQQCAARQAERRRTAYLTETEPFIRLQVEIMNRQPVRWICEATQVSAVEALSKAAEGSFVVIPEGTIPKREILWQQGDKELFDKIGECIDVIARKYQS